MIPLWGIKTDCALCEVRDESLYITQINFRLKMVNITFWFYYQCFRVLVKNTYHVVSEYVNQTGNLCTYLMSTPTNA